MQKFPSKLVENVVNEISKLPGIGRKTALRLALHLLRENKNIAEDLGNAIISMRNQIIYCKQCHNISDKELCEICSNPSRNQEILCVVEDVRDVIAIENTAQFKGYYHVLGGIISPIEGVGPADLNIFSLVDRLAEGNIKEVIMALSATVEGDTTNYYIFRKIKDFDITISTLARGVAIGDELEYADEITLGRSILYRTPYEQSLGR